MTNEQIIDKLETWRKEGSDCRDTPGSRNPHKANTLAYYMHVQGWLQRDLQLGLARANPRYRATQVGGNISEEGIRGGYGFAECSPYVETSS